MNRFEQRRNERKNSGFKNSLTAQQIIDANPRLKAKQQEIKAQFAGINALFDQIDRALENDDEQGAIDATEKIFAHIIIEVPTQDKSDTKKAIASKIKRFSV